jgi:glutathione peroxidase-family protein
LKHVPRWNFHKCPIDRDGSIAATVPSIAEPTDSSVKTVIERALADAAARCQNKQSCSRN